MSADIISKLGMLLPSAVTLIGVVATLLITNYLLRRNLSGELSVSHQLLMLSLTATGLLIFIFALPISETSRGQVLSLLGIVVTAVIALSSTTFVANIMAGLMLRAVNSFRPGDFVRSETFFGRVTERGIFHTEIQTEDRDLTTLPNLYLVTNPVTVVHDSGTIISATLSLGYDTPHGLIDELLKRAADKTELEDAFVLVIDLNDFSVSYRVGGFSKDTNQLLTTKSNLRKNILSILHEAGVEIASPSFMNQRILDPNQKILPDQYSPAVTDDTVPEDKIFDKAGNAAAIESLKQELSHTETSLGAVKLDMKEATKSDIPVLETKKEKLISRIVEIKEELDNPPPKPDGD